MLRALHESTGQRFRTANNVSIKKAIIAKANRLAYRRRAWESATRGRAAKIPAIVVTVHNAPPHGGGAAARVYRVLERMVARGADLVLCVSPDLERQMWLV